MKTIRINSSNLRNEEHFQFHTEFKDSVDKEGPKNLNIEAEFEMYMPYFLQEKEALLLIRKSPTTNQLADADTDRDNIIHGLEDAVKSLTNHFNPEKREAAIRLKILFDQYGNIARKPYDDETAAITKLIEESRGKYSADVAKAELVEWFTELEKRNMAFDVLMKNRYSEEAGRTELRMKRVRADIDTVYRRILDRLDAYMLLNGTYGFENFVRELNTRSEKYRDMIAQRKGRSAKEKEVSNGSAV